MNTKLLEKIAKLTAEVDKLREKLEEKPVELDWPKDGEEYFYINMERNYINTCHWENHSSDNFRKATGNCFRTNEEAKTYITWLLDPKTHTRRKLEQSTGFNPCADFMVLSEAGELVIRNVAGMCRLISFNFDTREDAAKAIIEIGEEAILNLINKE